LTQTSILPGEILKSKSLFLKKHALLKQLLLSQEELLFFQKILASSQETFVFLSRYFRYFEIHSCLLKKFLFFSQGMGSSLRKNNCFSSKTTIPLEKKADLLRK